ncbi:hypothetical protein [Nonomuraea sp. NPDC049480]|uniref:hypothetical protein n=1 Tax=Nonomuraea sp. NPDC049480 TaxID=3364353 RepID=UPI0037ADD379
MSKTITYVITYENGRWVSRCPTGETEGVGVASSLSQMERDLAEIHTWAWPQDTPGVDFVFDLPEEVAAVVSEYHREKELAESHTRRAAAGRQGGKKRPSPRCCLPSGQGVAPRCVIP